MLREQPEAHGLTEKEVWIFDLLEFGPTLPPEDIQEISSKYTGAPARLYKFEQAVRLAEKRFFAAQAQENAAQLWELENAWQQAEDRYRAAQEKDAPAERRKFEDEVRKAEIRYLCARAGVPVKVGVARRQEGAISARAQASLQP